ncbi:condensation domain-containing protein [Kitasatospora sp. NBC_01539]|uniref:condensation domain-containing protein n=1 Tax=Kitasatospora sp. NBC_01539 TaxID=2903577 RepID=UPI0038600A77
MTTPRTTPRTTDVPDGPDADGAPGTGPARPDDRRGLALRLLAARRQAASGSRGIPRVPRGGGPLICSAEQRRLWLADRIGGPSASPPVTAGLALEGVLDLDRLAAALAAVVDRHPVLRTRYAEHDGEPVQLLPEHPLTPDEARTLLETVDLTPVPAEEREALAQAVAVEAGSHRFDLATGPMLRLTVLRLAPDRHRLLLVCHHIAADARSAALLTGRLADAYRALAATDTAAPTDTTDATDAADAAEPEGPDYADYAVWSRHRLDQVLPERLAYWRHRLQGAAPVLELGLAAPREARAATGRSTASVTVRLTAGTVERLRAVGAGARLTAHTVLLAGFLVVVARCADRRDVTVGVVSGGRPHRDLDPVVGCFTDLLPLRVSLADDPAFRVLALRVRDALAAGLAQAAPFDRIVAAAAPRRAPGVHPLFQVLFVERDEGTAVAGAPDTGWGPGVDAHPWGQEVDGTAYDLTLAAGAGPDGAELVLTYPCARYTRKSVTGLAEALAELLAELAERPDAPVSTLRTAEPWRAPVRAAAPTGRAAVATTGAAAAPAGGGPVGELRALWCEVLGRAGVGDHDDLFALGGDSLAVVRIAARIEERYGVAVPASAFFESPTPAGFGAVLARLTEEHQHV